MFRVLPAVRPRFTYLELNSSRLQQMLSAYVLHDREKVNRWCRCKFLKLFYTADALRAVRVDGNSWETLGDTIRRCRINAGLWGCGRRRRFSVWIIFFLFYISNCFAYINTFSEKFLCLWIWQHTKTHKTGFRNRAFTTDGCPTYSSC